jgi:hypothetical protein
MKLSKILTAAALAAVLGGGAAPTFAGEISNMLAKAIQAAVVPSTWPGAGSARRRWPASYRSRAQVILRS